VLNKVVAVLKTANLAKKLHECKGKVKKKLQHQKKFLFNDKTLEVNNF